MRSDQVTPGSQTSLREANRSRIIGAIQQHGSITQVELAGITGLSPATVSNIVRELAGVGVLQTAPTSRSGRRAHRVALARSLGLVGGVHFGTRSMRIALADASLRVLVEQRMPLAPDHRADSGFERAAMLLSEMLASVEAPMDELLAIGVGVPAPVHAHTGEISTVGMLRGWDGVNVAETLEREFSVPVDVDNDANLGALGESRLGVGRGRDPVAYVQIAHRIGGGLVVGGQVVRGRSGVAGEIGHVTIDENGPICRCGNRGCLETFVGAETLLGLLAASHGNLSLRDVIAQAHAGDPGCRRVIHDAGTHIGVATASLCNLFDPEMVVVGGQLSEAGDLLLAPMRAAVEHRTVPRVDGAVQVVVSELGSLAEVRGALVVALDRAGAMGVLGGERG